MKYFLDESQRKTAGGTCYFVFQKAKFSNRFWLEDSLYLYADTFDSLMLFELFSESVEDFCYYAQSEVRKEAWQNLVAKSKENEQWTGVIEELRPWAEECFTQYECFTICGV